MKSTQNVLNSLFQYISSFRKICTSNGRFDYTKRLFMWLGLFVQNFNHPSVPHLKIYNTNVCMLVWHANSSSSGLECAKTHIKYFWDFKGFHGSFLLWLPTCWLPSNTFKEIHPFFKIRHQHKNLQWTPHRKFL